MLVMLLSEFRNLSNDARGPMNSLLAHSLTVTMYSPRSKLLVILGFPRFIEHSMNLDIYMSRFIGCHKFRHSK